MTGLIKAVSAAPGGQVVRTAATEAGPVTLRFADGTRDAVIGEGAPPGTPPKRTRRKGKAKPKPAGPATDQQALFE